MTKEAVEALWATNAQAIIQARGIKGGTVDKGWNQNICGTITLKTVLNIQANDKLDANSKLAACIAACAHGSNCSARGQALFSTKTQKATVLNDELIKLVK